MLLLPQTPFTMQAGAAEGGPDDPDGTIVYGPVVPDTDALIRLPEMSYTAPVTLKMTDCPAEPAGRVTGSVATQVMPVRQTVDAPMATGADQVLPPSML
jgi:hypothetical protein